MLSQVVLPSNFCLDYFLLYLYHRDEEDDFIRNVIMLLSEGLAGTKFNCTEVISQELNNLMLVICIKISQV